MASVFKTFSSNDITTTRTLLHEAIPITGTIVSGTYGTWPNEENIKNYSHNYFQSVYDYPYLSSSANHIFDISFGYGADSVYSASAGNAAGTTAQAKKHNMYYQMAQVLMGHNSDGTIKQFKVPGDKTNMDTVFFISFARLLVKDEIKKGSFNLLLMTGSVWDDKAARVRKWADADAANNFYTDSPAGEYGILTSSTYRGPGPGAASAGGDHQEVPGSDATSLAGWGRGLIFYQAGIMVLTASMALLKNMTGTLDGLGVNYPMGQNVGGTQTGEEYKGTFHAMATGSHIPAIADGFRHRIESISFNNTTELNSTIHFCRANHNDFNYSANKTYTSNSKIAVKNSSLDQPVTYITSIGLYSADNELLAVAKLSEPLKKTPENEATIRVRLDY
tara:strand:+ start:260 stop:1432 length:1173 start_codon:yes stop_codon:yes gene_type:complete